MNKIKPDYYTQGKEDLITYFANNFNRDKFIGFMTGNIIKYVVRFDGKNGLEDLAKAKEYIERLYDEVQKKQFKFGSGVKIPSSPIGEHTNLEDLVDELNGFYTTSNEDSKVSQDDLNYLDALNDVNERNKVIDKELEAKEELESKKQFKKFLNAYFDEKDDDNGGEWIW